MKISFLILNYNSISLTKKLIESIKNFSIIDYIIVVDNNSKDNSREELKKMEDEKIYYIFSNENTGYSKGNNLGLRYANDILKCKYVILANPDISVTETVLKECIDTLENSNEYAVVAPTIQNINSKGDIAWKIPNFYDDLLSLFYLTNKIVNYKLTYKNINDKSNIEVEVLPGSLLVLSLEKIKEVDYFDENVFLYCEERILAKKLKDKGYKSLLLTKSNYIHEHGTIIKKEFKSKINQYKILNRSKLYYIKNYSSCGLLKENLFRFMTKLSIIEKKILGYLK